MSSRKKSKLPWLHSIRVVAVCAVMGGCIRSIQAQPADVLEARNSPLPNGERLFWGEEPVETVSSKRTQIVLNGLWKFQPGSSGAREPAAVGWGYIRVPGSWRTGYTTISIPRVAAPGSGPLWAAWKNDALDQGWYERTLRIPADWKNRAIVLNFARISTDAWVYIDGKEAGRVAWPAGEVDVTRFVQLGREHSLRVFVATIPSNEQVGTFMGPGAGQISFADAKPESKGLIDDVVLASRPMSTHVSDVFVQPSTRRKQITLDVELTGVKQAGPLHLTARMERNGKVEKTFEKTISVQARDVQTVRVSWPWIGAALWDLDTPNLYTVKLDAKGAGLDDEYAQPFGFREFWIEGRNLFLNGIPIRFRPQLMQQEYSLIGGQIEHIEGVMKGMRRQGFNIAEMWPGTSERRGQHSFHHLYYDTADRLGFLLMGSAGNINDYVPWGPNNWKSPEAKAEWERLTQREVRLHRNHPSIILWSTSGNSFGHGHDQNPLAIGRDIEKSGLKFAPGTLKRAGVLKEALNYMRREDPTRPSFVHQGTVGDIWAVNSYLDFLPVQEGEEWLSDWAQHGTKPYLPIEFGAPLAASYQRGRADYPQAETSEPWLSEFAAIYLGPQAYKIETPDYRRSMREKYKGGQEYAWQGDATRNFSPANMIIQPMITRRIWRSWRALGTTAGMVPWEEAYATQHLGTDKEIAAPFKPGQRGAYNPKLRLDQLFYGQAKGGDETTPAGRALEENNGETLAYIGGKVTPQDKASVTDKQHAFWSGNTVEKTAVLINDTRAPHEYSYSWQARVNNKVVASGSKRGTLAVTQTLFLPLVFKAPSVSGKTNGTIELTSQIGTRKQSDSFDFRVWPRPQSTTGTVSVFDPKGRTSAMLRALGLKVVMWDGRTTKNLLVIGRDVLSSGSKPPGDLNTFAKNGGRVLVMEQDPEWMHKIWGFRVSQNVSRQIFPISATHSVGADLDALDLRDWAGSSRQRPAHEPFTGKEEEPAYGWHWGNRGGVSSAALEKPHLSGWRPILECEFDSAYSPLMELDMGQGRATLCLLDLEERFAPDATAPKAVVSGNSAPEAISIEPAADKLARQIVRWAQTAPLSPRAAHVALLGTPPTWFAMYGVRCDEMAMLPANTDLVIFAPDAIVDEAALTAFLQRGGKAVFLPRQSAGNAMDISLAQTTSIGSLDVPNWTLASGLSPSDLRWRNEASAWLVQPKADWQTGAAGQLAMRRVGKGVAVWLQLDPERFGADTKTYFRFTRWRQTRAVAQVLANMGATLRDDVQALNVVPYDDLRPLVSIPLAGEWQFAQTIDRPAAAAAGQLTDPGISDAARGLLDGTRPMQEKVRVPGNMAQLETRDGEVVARRVLDIPKEWAGKDLLLQLGRVDDFDNTFWNGESIGSVGAENSAAWNFERSYKVPRRLVKAGRNVLAVRIWDWLGGGGFSSTASYMTLSPAGVVATPFLYHPDYRTDFIAGDNPFRYKRW